MNRLTHFHRSGKRSSLPFLSTRIGIGFCVCLMLFFACLLLHAATQQPTEPVDISPIDGEVYYVINQLTGLQLDLDENSTAAGAGVVVDARSFTSLSQRWALTKMPTGLWSISNVENGLCLDRVVGSATTLTVQNPCVATSATQQWSLAATSNGYATLKNAGTGLVLDLLHGSGAAGSAVSQTAAPGKPTQSQQWLLRPAFFRGVDTALLEKQEAERVAGGYPWWKDAGKVEDVLQLLKSHGVNMVRVRPTSEPPYATYSATTCNGNGCYTETDAADLNLAKRAKQLGMSVELTLLFDGGSSTAIPGAWSGYTLAQAESAVYSYVKSEIEAYRSAGVMPDMVTVGNEVDTGFLGALGSPTGNDFGPFAALEKQGMQAIADASAETTSEPALPVPIRCIHITPNWSLTSFFGYVNSNSIPYDAMCQSYYPMYHGPLTQAQAEASNPYNQPVEETALTAAANSYGKPIFILETGEHYENGFDANDPWYPATVAGQRQFLIDLDTAVKGLPDHLGMGIEYWDPEGVNIPKAGGGYTNGDELPNAIYTWNGLTLFDNADATGSTNSSAANYAAVLEGVDALGGKLDSTPTYKLVNVGNGEVLETVGSETPEGMALSTGVNTGGASLRQQWKFASDDNGYLQIASANSTSGAANVLDTDGASSAGSKISANPADTGKLSQEWNVVTAGGGSYAIVSRVSGLVLAASGTSSAAIEEQAPAAMELDWISPANASQEWQIIPVHITESGAAAALSFAPTTAITEAYGTPVGSVRVHVIDGTGAPFVTSSVSVTLNVTGPGGFVYKTAAASSSGMVNFNLASLVLKPAGAYTMSVSAAGLGGASTSIDVTKAVLKVTANNAMRAYGATNPAFQYAMTGFVDGDTQSVVTGAPVLSSTATPASAPGHYPIAIVAGSLAAANYTFALAPGSLTITTASTAITLGASSTTVYPGKNITLTATVTAAAKPVSSGTVTFLNGKTVLGTATVNSSGVTKMTTSSLTAGANEIVAEYAGNADYSASRSSALTINLAEFTLAASASSLKISAGSSSVIGLTLTPVGGYAGTIKMSCATAIPGVSCTVSPAAFTATGSSTALKGTMTVKAAVTASGSGAVTVTAYGTSGPITQSAKISVTIP